MIPIIMKPATPNSKLKIYNNELKKLKNIKNIFKKINKYMDDR